MPGTRIFGVDSGSAHAAEPQIENLRGRRMNLGVRDQLRLRIGLLKLVQGDTPEVVEIGRTWRDAAVNF